MINYSEAGFSTLSIHSIGNKAKEESLILTDDVLPIHDENIKNLLCKYFFNSFKVPEYFSFTDREENLENNELYKLASGVFADPSTIHAASVDIAKRLYDSTDNANIKSGDLIITYIQDVMIEDELVSAIGIFKSESKDDFLKLLLQSKAYNISSQKGINVNKLDKACIIINSEKSEGYKVLATDQKKLNGEAQYWMNDFLNVRHRHDDFNNTTVYIQATKSFIEEKLKDEFEMDKKDEFAFMNNSKEYFDNNENFNEKDYLESVFYDDNVIKAFDDYKEDKQLNLSSNFDVSTPAVKRMSGVFKSVIKLDKNFHIYVHGNKEWIQKGVDEDGRKFYKVYYEEES